MAFINTQKGVKSHHQFSNVYGIDSIILIQNTAKDINQNEIDLIMTKFLKQNPKSSSYKAKQGKNVTKKIRSKRR